MTLGGTDGNEQLIIFWPNLKIVTDTKESKTTYGKIKSKVFPGGAVVESLPANAGDTGSSPGLGRSHMPRSS